MEKLTWMQPHYTRAIFIPVGANFPVGGEAGSRKSIARDGTLNIAVFSVTGAKFMQREVGEITDAVKFAASRLKNLKLTVFGRNAKDAEGDMLLFVRGPISTRRSSAIAGIACGLPVIAAEGPETSAVIKDAGVAFYSPQKKGNLGEVLLHVLEDEHYRALLAQRSWIAQQRSFSWNVIARRYEEFLEK
jgi:glycosyltransferase involved in cell wall biosynthesis